MRRGSICSIGLATILLVYAIDLVPADASPAGQPVAGWTVTLPIDLSGGSVAMDRSGDTYVTGTRTADEPAAVLRKLGPDGSALWTRVWSPRGADRVSGEYVSLGSDGSVYLAGSVASHYEGGAWFLRSYTADGDLRWSRFERGWRHGRTADAPTGLAVSRDQVVLAGRFEGCCGDFRIIDGWVRAFGIDGSHRWRSPFEAPGLGVYSDDADVVAIGSAGRSYVVGWTALGPESEEVAAPHELFIQALDANGRPIWSRTYPATAYRDQHFEADAAVRGKVLAVSAVVDGVPVEWRYGRPGRAWLSSLTLEGDPVWTRRWGTTWSRAAQPVALALGAHGRITVVGTRHDPSDHGLDAFVRRYTSRGQLRWNVTLEEDQRLMEASDVAWTRRGFTVSGEAMKSRFEPFLGYVWMRHDHGSQG